MQSRTGGQPQMSMNGFANFAAPTPPGQINVEMKSAIQSRSNAAQASMSINKSYIVPQKGAMKVLRPQNSTLLGAVNMAKASRASNISMSAGFGTSGAPLGRSRIGQKNDESSEFSVTYNGVDVE